MREGRWQPAAWVRLVFVVTVMGVGRLLQGQVGHVSSLPLADVDFARLGLARGDLVRLDVDTTPGRALDVDVPLGGQSCRLKLAPWSVRAPGFVLYEAGASGLVAVDPGPENTLRGEVVKSPGSLVAAGVMPDGLYATVLFPDGRRYWIEPAASRQPGLPAGTHVVYQASDVLQGPWLCATDEGHHRAPVDDGGGATTRATTRYTAEVAVEADFEFFNRYGSTSLVNARIALIYNVVNVQYERDVDIQHAISSIIVDTAEPDPYTTNDINATLAEMKSYWNANRAGVARDIAHLFTGKPTGANVGVSYIGVVCSVGSAGWGYGISQVDYNNSNLASASDLVAHETGHNWAACHCTCSSPAYTMNPWITGICRFGAVSDQCSTNSIAAIIGHRSTRSCLATASFPTDPPLNDSCALAMPVGPGAIAFSTANATSDGPAACATMGPDVWYSYTAPADGTVTVSTCGSSLDSVLVAYSGGCGALVQVACNDDSNSCAAGSRQSMISFPVARGAIYLIRMAGFNGAVGSGILTLAYAGCSPPANDTCAAATPVGEGSFAFTTICAGTDGWVDNAAGCAAFGYSQTGSDVWFLYTPTCEGTAVASTCGSAYDTKLAVYLACPVGPYQALACDDDSCGLQSSVAFAAAPGNSYYIRVGGYNAAQGPGVLSITNAGCPPAINDSCLNAVDVSAGGVYSGNLLGATLDGTATCGSSAGNPDVWYRFTTCGPCILNVSTCGTHDLGGVDAGTDTALAIFDSCGGTQLACNDDALDGACGAADLGNFRDSLLAFPLGAGQTVLIRVSKYAATPAGPFVIKVSSTPANDSCASSQAVAAGSHPFCTLGATDSGISEACLAQGQVFKDVWFSFVAPYGAPVRVSTCDPGTAFDTTLAVYAGGCPTGDDSALACDDDDPACSSSGLNSSALFHAVPGQSYLFRVGAYSASTPSGSGVLLVTAYCPADLDDGTGAGARDQGVDVNDLIYFLETYEAGLTGADLDNGTTAGTPDGGVDINDLLFFLAHYESGC